MKILKYFSLLVGLWIVWITAGCALSQENFSDGKVIFRSNQDGNNYDLFVMNLDGSNQRKLADFLGQASAPDDNNGLVPSPDGKQIAFLSDKDGGFGIYVIDIESGAQSNLTKNLGDVSSFTWSPDGKHIIFVSDHDTALIDEDRGLWTNNIYVIDADGNNVRRLTFDDKAANYGGLSWSSNGSELVLNMVLLSQRGGPLVSTIYLMMLNDSNLIALTSPSDLAQTNPSWSPNGDHIMYLKGTKQIYVMQANGTNQIALFNEDLGYIINAAWSPDGEHIVFSTLKLSDDKKYYFIYVVQSNGTGLVALSKDPSSHDTSPSWSPDGKYIVFASKRDGGQYHLYIMNADGTNQRRLTNELSEEASPIWLQDP